MWRYAPSDIFRVQACDDKTCRASTVYTIINAGRILTADRSCLAEIGALVGVHGDTKLSEAGSSANAERLNMTGGLVGLGVHKSGPWREPIANADCAIVESRSPHMRTNCLHVSGVRELKSARNRCHRPVVLKLSRRSNLRQASRLPLLHSTRPTISTGAVDSTMQTQSRCPKAASQLQAYSMSHFSISRHSDARMCGPACRPRLHAGEPPVNGSVILFFGLYCSLRM